ncbi:MULTISPECIES: NADH-quinone oxidoreductase subunit NuoE [unclassified Streptomyces]|uniref:NADH-quinone oxidoreductase subunit NuoE n=1 Tax=unclassified Streptomyces TaxID=2593676 RepID=UPI00210B4F7B|nr:NADH-quinone oxidoreductase subunit NuoE [Streptomyces sp. DvalAA-14]
MPALPAPDFPAEVRARLEADAKEVIARYPGSRSALLPLLHLVQSEEGFVSRTGIRFCAEVLDLTTAEVTAVSTFYSMYRRKPSGQYQVGVCTNTLCAVMGGDAIFEELQQHLGVGNDETTEDGKVTLEHIECNAACDYAPVVMVNWEFFDNQTPQSAKQLVDDLIAGQEVSPTRGAPLCTYKETSRILAGFPDRREGAVAATGGAGPASLAGLNLHREDASSGRPAGRPGESAGGGSARQGTADGPGTYDTPTSPSPAQHPSSHDAPGQTAASDPAHPADPVADNGNGRGGGAGGGTGNGNGTGTEGKGA